jgi:purine-binding chemotaxis protein CheW
MSQYASFRLGEHLFGIDLLRIREIDRIVDLTPVPGARDHVRGLINLRGQIVTVLDLGVRLGLPRRELGPTSHAIILKTRADLAAQGGLDSAGAASDPAGFLVDAIGDVAEAGPAAIEPPSANVGEAEARFLSGVVRTDAGLMVLLDLPAVLAGD